MSQTVHICALAARTPVGLIAETAAAAVRAGISRIEEHPVLIDRRGQPVIGCFDGQLTEDVFGLDRMVALARTALFEIHAKLGVRFASLPMMLAVPDTRPGWTQDHEEALVRHLSKVVEPAVPASEVYVAGRGHAGALHALGMAAEEIAAGMRDLWIVGGVDSYFDSPVLNWLDERRMLAENARAGFMPGEAASFIAVTNSTMLRSLGLSSLATIRGWDSTTGPSRLHGAPRHTGTALAAVIHGATRGLGAIHEKVDDIYCDINGERCRSEEWAFALLRAHERIGDGTRAITGCRSWGDVGAATGSLLCVLAARAWARRYASGPLALTWASSPHGLRSAVVLQAPAT